MNPYAAPSTVCSNPDKLVENYRPRLFSWNGRIGRLRWLTYNFVLWVLVALVIGVLAWRFTANGADPKPLVVLAQLAWALSCLFVTRRRLQDLDRGNAWLILLFIPLVSFLFMIWLLCAGGDKGENRYGMPPAPNSAAVICCATFIPTALPVILTVAMLTSAFGGIEDAARAQSQAAAR